MTSSATQTDRPRYSRLWTILVGGVVVLAGWFSILAFNRWYFTPPVFFLFCAWAGLVSTGWFLSQAGWTAATDEDDEAFWRPQGRRDELEREKRSLLKAIKEIEFDHQMGKMSDDDAAELTQFYRARAIEVIKALETGGEAPDVVGDEIDRDLKARLAIASASQKSRKKRTKAPAKAGAAKPKGEDAKGAKDAGEEESS